MSELKPPPQLGEQHIASTLQWITKKMKRHDLNIMFKSSDERNDSLDKDTQIVLAQCTEELLFNIVKHANTNEAWMELSYPDNRIKIVIEDHGKGFNNDQNELDLTKDEGFGLFNIRERIDMLGGRTDIVSELGEGTKVSLTIPMEGENVNRSAEQTPKDEKQQMDELQSEIKILLVDDHKMMREGLKSIIEGENDLNVVAEAESADNIIKLVEDTKPDVAIMDVNLPGINGITATQKIKNEHSDVGVVGLSLYDDEQVAREMRNAGAVAYLTKTDAFETLCATIRGATGTG